MTADQRLLLVHAHPDDESIGQGATMAKYVAEGRGVTLVTCTAGEMGEILVPELEHLAADQEDTLGEHRRGELEAAMKELGRHRPPLPRRLRHLPRLRHEVARGRPRGRRRRRPRQRLLERRPHRGRRPPGRGDPRGPPAGAGHLRPVRRLRPPRPHPGPPGRDVRRAARRRAVVPPRPRRGLGHRQDLLGRDVGEPDARGPARAARRRRHHDASRAWTPTARCRPSSTADERPRRRRRRARTASSRRWTRCAPTPPRSPPTARSSRCPTTSGSTAWGIEYFRIAKGTPGPRGRGRARDRPVRRALMRPWPRGGGARRCSCVGAGTALADRRAARALVGAAAGASPRPRVDARRAAARLVVAAAVRARLDRHGRLAGRRPRPEGDYADQRRLRGLRCCSVAASRCWCSCSASRRCPRARAPARPAPGDRRVRPATEAAPYAAPATRLPGAVSAAGEGRRPGRPGRASLVLALLVGGGYAAAYAVAGDKLARGTTVAGVDVGGRTPDAGGRACCARGWPTGAARRSRSRVGGPPAEHADARARPGSASTTGASVAQAGGQRSWRPVAAVGPLHRRRGLDPVVTVDQARMDAAGRPRSRAEVGTPAARRRRRASRGERIEVTAPADRRALDRGRDRARRSGRRTSRTAPSAELTLHQVEPGHRRRRRARGRWTDSPTPRCPARSRCSSAGRPGAPAARATTPRRCRCGPSDGRLVPTLDEAC